MILSLCLLSFIFIQEGESWFVDRVAVKVNDKIITEQELILTYQQQKRQFLQNYMGTSLEQDLEKLWNDTINDAVDQLVLYEKAVELGINISEESVDGTLQNQKESHGMTQEEFEKMILEQTGMSLQQYVESTIRFQSGQRVVQSRVWGTIMIDDPEVAKYYEENIVKFTNPETFQIAEIVFQKGENPSDAQARAKECLDQIRQQDLSFKDAVQKYSEAASKAIDGDLGELVLGDLNKTIEDAALALRVGDVSQVIDTEASFYIIKLLKRTKAFPKPIDDVKEEIKMTLREPRFEVALEKFLTELRESYLIDKMISKPSSGY